MRGPPPSMFNRLCVGYVPGESRKQWPLWGHNEQIHLDRRHWTRIWRDCIQHQERNCTWDTIRFYWIRRILCRFDCGKCRRDDRKIFPKENHSARVKCSGYSWDEILVYLVCEHRGFRNSVPKTRQNSLIRRIKLVLELGHLQDKKNWQIRESVSVNNLNPCIDNIKYICIVHLLVHLLGYLYEMTYDHT